MNNQINSAVRKIHNLLSSGAVTVTGPNQPRILKQKVGSTTVTPTNLHVNSFNRCYVCDEALGLTQSQHQLIDMQTSHTSTKFPNKIGQLVGEAFIVIVSADDVVCSRCMNLINYLDRLENDVERVRTNLMNLLHKKYGLNDEGGGCGGSGSSGDVSPPIKIQKLNSGTINRSAEDLGDMNRVRKVMHGNTRSDSPLGKQLPPVSGAVQQIKISSQPVQQQSAGTQTIQRKTTKIYKCPTCEYKTSDMRLFNTHYENCKQQNFQCKNCKQIFPNFGTMKQHMVREHNTSMDNTCSICHINFVNDASLRKHMEMNHSTNVIVTSTTTLPAGAAVPMPASENIAATANALPLYTCSHCQFKSTDKIMFDDHMRKHMSGAKPKPFKCRLCAQRFETREAATVHAKQHQPNYFKCGTCSMSFPKRELLVKHFEVHQQPATQTIQHQVAAQNQGTVVKQTSQVPTQNLLTTQKLLQDTIDEALSESVAVTTGTTEVSSTASNNIRFYSCHVCSLTFIQENYYNQHMETHRREKKIGSNTGVVTTAGAANITNSSSSLVSINTTSASLLNDGYSSSSVKKESDHSSAAHQSASNSISANISEVDIESIFEKMHSDKGDSMGISPDTIATSAANTVTTNTTIATNSAQSGDNLVITSQEGSGGITFNITIPQPDGTGRTQNNESSRLTPTTSAPVSVSIDMPMLDQPDESALSSTDSKLIKKEFMNETDTNGKISQTSITGPVSMPSLDDDHVTSQQNQLSNAAESTIDENQSNELTKNCLKSENNVKTEGENNVKLEGNSEGGETAGTEMEHNVHTDDGETGATAEQLVAAAAAAANEQQVAMELDEAMQAQVESGQIKFILNENGQLLQLDNHIITDADGNQILVQDPEQIQQLLQSVGVLQSGDGLDGETLQMMTDGNGQMVLVQGENNETQLIDASLLNADGQLVIQQGQDGELGEGAHVIGEDGTRIPVSVSYTADGQPIVQVQQQVLDGNEGQHVLDKDVSSGEEAAQNTDGAVNASSGGFFALEELMQQSSDAKAPE